MSHPQADSQITHAHVTSPDIEALHLDVPRVDGARVTVAHDYVTQRGGAERVALALLASFPGASLVTSVYQPTSTFQGFEHHHVQTSWLQRLPAISRDPRYALPLLPRAWRTMGVADTSDVVIASSTGFAHTVKTTARKVVYCHNPPRWLYQREDYLLGQPRPVKAGLAALSPYLRRADQRGAATADRYIANSTSVAARIKAAYGIDAPVVFPPVVMSRLLAREPVEGVEPGYYLVVARSRAYKNTLVACQAVESIPGARLVVLGDLPARPDGGTWTTRIRSVCDVSDSQLRWLYAGCTALIAPSFEDFGLTPVEAAVFGKPTVALRAGGYLDTVNPTTGVFADELSPDCFAAAIETVARRTFSPELLMTHARTFNLDRFSRQMHAHVADVLES